MPGSNLFPAKTWANKSDWQACSDKSSNPATSFEYASNCGCLTGVGWTLKYTAPWIWRGKLRVSGSAGKSSTNRLSNFN
jgi:hypothetical protein